MVKEEVYNLRWDSDLKKKVQQYAQENGYDDMAKLIREAIREKIDPVMRQEQLEKEIKKLFQDPAFRKSLGLK